jgi:hypothetical protein
MIYDRFRFDRVYIRTVPIRWFIPKMNTGLIMYRLLNVSGSETKVTVMGDNILRITDGGRTVQWDKYTGFFTWAVGGGLL